MQTRPLMFSLLVTGFMLASCRSSGDDKVRTRMDDVIRFRAANQDFAGSVLVLKGDHIFFDKSYGMANREWSIPNTPTTKFQCVKATLLLVLARHPRLLVLEAPQES